MPLYRLKAIFERNGLQIDRATQCLWCREVADLLQPLYRLMIDRVVATDDTVMPIRLPDKTAKTRMWAYIGDEANP